MKNYEEQFKAVQEFAFGILREYPLSKEPIIVLEALVEATNRDRIDLFEFYKAQERTAEQIYYELESSGSVSKTLENIGLVLMINK